MKTPDEIKRGLMHCSSKDDYELDCDDCTYATDESCVKHICCDALTYINQLKDQFRDVTKLVAPSEPALKWISVENSLPSEENVDKFLVVFERRAGRTVEMARYMNGRLTLLAFEAPDGKITHWMPLPDPPKGE